MLVWHLTKNSLRVDFCNSTVGINLAPALVAGGAASRSPSPLGLDAEVVPPAITGYACVFIPPFNGMITDGWVYAVLLPA